MAYVKVKTILTFSLWLWCLAAYANSACTSNLKLIITDQNNNYDASGLCLEEISSPSCRKFVNTFNRSDLPDTFQTETEPISRPSGINLVGLVQDYEYDNRKFKIPGLRIKWNSPTDEMSRKYVEGYVMIWANETVTSCRLFKLNTSSPLLSKNIIMSYDVSLYAYGSNYTVTVYSMPTPYSKNKDDSERFVRMKMTSFVMYEIGVSPGAWTPSVSTKTWPNGTIEVRFTLSPPEYNFTSFRLCLVKANDINNCINETFYTGNLYSALETEGFVTFNYLTNNSYHVVVNPNDTYRNIEGQCLCWEYEKNNCKNACAGISTEMFNVTVTETPGPIPTSLPTSPATTSTTTLVGSSSTPPKEAEKTSPGSAPPNVAALTDAEIAAITVVLAGVFVIAVIVFLLCRRRDMQQIFQKFISWLHRKMCSEAKPKTERPPPPSTPLIDSAGPLQVKKLYVMSADDHSKHAGMVESLKNYLELHCQCKVVYPPTAPDIHNFPSLYTWFISKMSNTDHIIFVTSVGAEKLMEAHLSHKTYRDREFRPEGDLFTECLKYIFKDNKARDKVINIHFGDTKMESEYMKSAFTYSIPRNLPELLLKIHQLNSKQKDAFSRKLPLLRENIPNLPGGMELLTAIESSLQYEKDNSDWFKLCFGKATPLSAPSFEKMVSLTDSGIGDMGQRSVSDTDLNHHGQYDEVTFEPRDLTQSVYTVPFSDAMGDAVHSESDHVIPPSADFEIVSSFTDAMNNINRASDIYENNEDLELWKHIQPPETMSSVEEISEAFLNINKLSDSIV